MEAKSKAVKKTPYVCPVEVTVDIIGGKWKAVILFHLLDGKKRFGELKKLYPSISQRILTLQLRQLEHDQIVKREVYAEVPPRVEYSLTEFGESLAPLILELKAWGKKYEEKVLHIKNEQAEDW